LPSLRNPPPPAPLRDALIAQVFGAFVAVGLLFVGRPSLLHDPLGFALVQGICAALVSFKLAAPPWWLPIHLGFTPLAVLASRLTIAPSWWLGAFILLLLIFWRTDKSRVPLYLTNATTARALLRLLPRQPCRVIDLGCGNGGLLRELALARPDCEFYGLEHAPLPWLWARGNALGLHNVTVRRGDFWRQGLGDFDLVYAFLSPTPMSRLWEKACAEMKPSACLVSNSFAIEDVAPDQVVEVADRRATRLYCYRPPPAK
jgi:SAM-dependent methyltransferase